MKIKHLLLSAIAVATALVSCQKEDLSKQQASISTSVEAVSFEEAAGTQTITLTSNRQWEVELPADAVSWIAISPDKGEASADAQPVEITVKENTGNDRTAIISFRIVGKRVEVKVTQKGQAGAVIAGEGTEENPYRASEAYALVKDMAADVATPDKVYVKGVVCSIKNDSGVAQYGNIDFYISDKGNDDASDRFLVFQCLSLGGKKFTSADQLKVGDEVVVYAHLVNFKGNTPETVGKGDASLYSLNGEKGDGGSGEIVGTPEGDGTEASPYNVAAATAKANENTFTPPADNEKINALPEHYVKGKVSSIKNIDTGNYGNAEFYISDDGTTTGEFLIYRCMYLDGAKFTSSDQLKVGDEVVVKGKLFNAFGNTPEMSSGCVLISINGSAEAGNWFSVSTSALNVSADAESATFKVSANVAWSAAVTEGDFVKILSGASGDGDGDVVLELSKNTSTTAARTAKIAVTTTADVANKTLEVVINQRAKVEGGAGPVEISWSDSDWSAATGANTNTLTKNGYTITVNKESGSTAPALRNDGSCRLYAKGTLTISGPDFKSVEIVLANDAKERYCAVTADSGAVGAQAADDTSVYWTGSATDLVFTVGDKAIYGTDGASKAGQLRFAKLIIE